MKRRRMISPSIWDDPEVGELDPLGFKLFIGCISLADDDGRLDADPRTLRKTIFGYTEGMSVDDVRQVRDSMAANLPNLQLYQVDGREYIALLKWDDHQAISASWHQDSIIPAPPAADEVAHDDHLPSTCPPHDDHLPTKESIKQVQSKASEKQASKQSKQSKPPLAAALQKTLEQHGIRGQKLATLLHDVWITSDRVRGCWNAIRQRENVRNPVGLLVAMLEAHDEPPTPPPRPEDDNNRYISGKYGEFIQH